MAKPPMAHVSVRVPEKLWAEVRNIADREELNPSDVLRAALEEYVRQAQ